MKLFPMMLAAGISLVATSALANTIVPIERDSNTRCGNYTGEIANRTFSLTLEDNLQIFIDGYGIQSIRITDPHGQEVAMADSIRDEVWQGTVAGKYLIELTPIAGYDYSQSTLKFCAG